MASRISIKELHRTTGEHVRKAARSNAPITITDRGKPVAILAKPTLLAGGPRRRTLLPEYKALLARKTPGSVIDDLDSIRGDR